MASFFQSSSQKTQLLPSRTDDVFSDFHNFRNETKRRAQASHSKLMMESPLQSQVSFQPYTSNAFGSTKNSTQPLFVHSQSVSGHVPNTRHASNISPQKKSTMGIQRLSPQKSYIYRENLHENCQSHQNHKQSQFTHSNINQFPSGLDNLQRELKEISFSKHFNHQINAARQQSKQKLANLSPNKRSPMRRTPLNRSPIRQNLYSPHRSSGRKSFTPSLQQNQGISQLYISSQFQQSPLKRRNSYQPRNFNVSTSLNQAGKVISYSPTRYSQRLFSPNRLLNRLNSPVDAQFQEFEFPATQNSPQINFRAAPSLTSQIPASQNFGPTLRRSNSFSGNSLNSLLHETKIRVKNSGIYLSPRSQIPRNQVNQNNSYYFSPNSRNTDIFNSSRTAYIVDKRAHDLEDYLKTLTISDFNTLPRDNVEQLIKLSSVIMSKVKNSNYYRTSLF